MIRRWGRQVADSSDVRNSFAVFVWSGKAAWASRKCLTMSVAGSSAVGPGGSLK
jgi:hypothetical protein